MCVPGPGRYSLLEPRTWPGTAMSGICGMLISYIVWSLSMSEVARIVVVGWSLKSIEPCKIVKLWFGKSFWCPPTIDFCRILGPHAKKRVPRLYRRGTRVAVGMSRIITLYTINEAPPHLVLNDKRYMHLFLLSSSVSFSIRLNTLHILLPTIHIHIYS